MGCLIRDNNIYSGGSARLFDLLDVNISNPSNGDVIQYNSTNQKYENSGILKEQEVVPSKNLLYNNAVTCDIDGIHFEVYPNGTVLANRTGTSTGTVTLGIGRLSSEYIGKTVKAVGCPAGGSPTTYEFSDNGGVNRDRGDGVTFTYNNEYFQIAIRQTEPCNNVLFKPMITEDTDATYNDYEKYWKALKDAIWTKEQQKINGAYNLCSNEKLSTKIVGSTLTVTFNPTGYPKGSVRLQGYVSTGQWITVNYRTMKLKQNQKYKLCGIIGGHSSTYRLRYYDDAGGSATVYDDDTGEYITEFVCKNPNTSQVDIYVNTGATASNPIDTIIYPMVTTDLTATYRDYVPHAMTNLELMELADGISTTSVTPNSTYVNTNDGYSFTIGKWGHFAILHAQFKTTSSVALNTEVAIATIPSGYRPKISMAYSTHDTGYSLTAERHDVNLLNEKINLTLRNQHDNGRWVSFTIPYICE